MSSTDAVTTRFLAALVVMTALLFFLYFIGDLPVLREARGMIYYGGWIDHFSLWQEIAHPVAGIAAPNRMTAMLFSALDARVCGFSTTCLNASQALLLAAAAGLLFVHLVQLLGQRWVAALLALLWCLSLPALEGALWQATQLDKLATIFSLLYLIALFHFLRSPGSGVAGRLASNLLLAVLLFLAFKAKEISFFLVPVTVLAVALEGAPEGRGGILARARFALLPVAYGIYYLQHYLRHVPTDMAAHIGGGNPVLVVPVLLGAMLGHNALLAMGNGGPGFGRLEYPAVAMMTLATVVAAFRLVGVWRSAGVLDRSVRTAVYLAGVVGCNLLLTARTAAPHAYYLMIAEGAFLGLIGLAALAPAGRPAPAGPADSWSDAARRFGLPALLGLAVLLLYAAQGTPGAAATRLRRMGHLVNDGFATIRAAAPPDASDDVRFLFPRPIDGDWYFFGSIENDGRPDPELMSFVYGTLVPVKVTNLYGPTAGLPANPQRTLRMVWDADGRAREIALGSARVFTSARP